MKITIITYFVGDSNNMLSKLEMIYIDISEDMFYNTMVSSIINRVPIIIQCTNMDLYSSIFVFEAFERFFRGGYIIILIATENWFSTVRLQIHIDINIIPI